jgi:hypothetical protein
MSIFHLNLKLLPYILIRQQVTKDSEWYIYLIDYVMKKIYAILKYESYL